MIERLLVSTWLLMGSLPVWAQTEQGVSWWAAYSRLGNEQRHQFQDISQTNTLAIGFTQGTFVRPNLLLGAELELARTHTQSQQGLTYDASTDNRLTSLAVAPFLRRFWGEGSLRGYVGGGVRVEYSINRIQTANTKTRPAENLITNWHLRPELQAGVVYIFSRHWGINLSGRSSVLPIAFSDLSLGLVMLTGVRNTQPPAEAKQETAPLTKGNWLLSGTFDLGTDRQQLTSAAGALATNVETRQSQQYSFSPSVGLFTGQRWLVGLSIPINRRLQTNTFVRSAAQTVSSTSASVTIDGFGLSPFAKKYLTTARFGPFVAARAGWQRTRTYGGGAVADVYSTTYHWHLGAGLAYLLGPRFIVEGELGSIGSEWSMHLQTGESARRFDVTATLRPAFTLSYVL